MSERVTIRVNESELVRMRQELRRYTEAARVSWNGQSFAAVNERAVVEGPRWSGIPVVGIIDRETRQMRRSPIMHFGISQRAQTRHEFWKMVVERNPGERWPAAVDWRAPEIKVRFDCRNCVRMIVMRRREVGI